VGEAGRDAQVTFTFRGWASAKTTDACRETERNAFTGDHHKSDATYCTKNKLSAAQLNECDVTAACDAATYSVNGTQQNAHALSNTSSRGGKTGFFPRIHGTCVPKVTAAAIVFTTCSLTDKPAEIPSGWQNCFLSARPATLSGMPPCT